MSENYGTRGKTEDWPEDAECITSVYPSFQEDVFATELKDLHFFGRIAQKEGRAQVGHARGRP
jgi:hypothetical protein